MDSIQHICNKLTAERAHHRQSLSTASTPPPPYTSSDTTNAGNDSDSDNSDDETDDTPAPHKPTTMSSSPPPLTLTINAAHQIQGSNNLVPTSPSILADARNFSALLLAAVQQLNASAAEGGKKGVRVDLTINCGVTVVGDRNVIGNVGLRARGLGGAGQGSGVVGAAAATAGGEGGGITGAGAKRKAEEDVVDEGEPEAKRICSA
ncbi:hypothetical protein LTR91_007880 [Friedmanniomyces endolithicus]|uniref:Uncharacterized protein n=1 Tax=Friedmanniomyces endolithicus TaxID=329885 RepID=A0A4U0UW75_9PEZI|nr:hypothetical protein LTS09_012512 [Friedmanniomyces endolithicus]KAK0279900.1 hypothetical protein LTS00_013280 [Friedmanniomyces endolithicus]KAK0305394.1 hypothetical protein LTR01_006920 [Friedmanniomyces endolithicus]KAK0310994.1 hypothetical protein LTR82_014443 [Friedmanniomyces endolithicus]KAK0835592.1 hypothetical protein LTR73_000088 [Friedmanniomyces endolithicus]